jgi:hypothetical protein
MLGACPALAMTAIASTRIVPRRYGCASRQASARRLNRASLRAVMASKGCPNAVLERVLTSTKTVSFPSRATRAFAPRAHRPVRSMRV